MIKLEGVSFAYNTQSQLNYVLEDISIAIPKGSFCALIGPSGAGKSTLLALLNGLLKPTKGRISVENQDIAELLPAGMRQLRHRVGLVWQFPERQLFADTVAADIAFGLEHIQGPELQSKIDECLRLVGLDLTIAERSPFALSGGQQRRVALAGILAREPEILVLDEPTVGLDPIGRQQLLKLLTYLHRDDGKTIVLVSHDMDLVAELAQRVFVLGQRRLIAQGSPQEVFRAEVMQRAGLELPLGAYLESQLAGLGFQIREVPEQPLAHYGIQQVTRAIADLVGGRANER